MVFIKKIIHFILKLLGISKGKTSKAKTNSFKMDYTALHPKDSKTGDNKSTSADIRAGANVFKRKYLARQSQKRQKEVNKTELSKRELQCFGTFSPVRYFAGAKRKGTVSPTRNRLRLLKEAFYRHLRSNPFTGRQLVKGTSTGRELTGGDKKRSKAA